jgi:rhodanese-related sulfurtransferase
MKNTIMFLLVTISFLAIGHSQSSSKEKIVLTKDSDSIATLMTIEEVVQNSHTGVEYVNNDYLIKRIDANPKLILLDVRTKDEYDAGHLKGATWLERGIAEFTLARTLRDPDAEIIVYCKKGNRSGLVVKALKQIGYRNVKAHEGFDAWVEAGYSFFNYLGEAKIVKLRPLNAASVAVDYYASKK